MTQRSDRRESTTTAEVDSLRDEICANLSRFMKEAQASQSELARAAGVTPTAVAKWLSGESTLGPDKYKPVCEFLGVPMHALLGEESSYTEMSKAGRSALALFEQLDDVGQTKAIAYLEDLVATGKYPASD